MLLYSNSSFTKPVDIETVAFTPTTNKTKTTTVIKTTTSISTTTATKKNCNHNNNIYHYNFNFNKKVRKEHVSSSEYCLFVSLSKDT